MTFAVRWSLGARNAAGRFPERVRWDRAHFVAPGWGFPVTKKISVQLKYISIEAGLGSMRPLVGVAAPEAGFAVVCAHVHG